MHTENRLIKPANAVFVTDGKVLYTMVKSDIVVLIARGSPRLPKNIFFE